MIIAKSIDRKALDVPSNGKEKKRVDAYFVSYDCRQEDKVENNNSIEWVCRFEVPIGTKFVMSNYENRASALNACGYQKYEQEVVEDCVQNSLDHIWQYFGVTNDCLEKRGVGWDWLEGEWHHENNQICKLTFVELAESNGDVDKIIQRIEMECGQKDIPSPVKMNRM